MYVCIRQFITLALKTFVNRYTKFEQSSIKSNIVIPNVANANTKSPKRNLYCIKSKRIFGVGGTSSKGGGGFNTLMDSFGQQILSKLLQRGRFALEGDRSKFH